ncbi:Ig-like domain-containing protein [Paenibacillus sp. TAB 01]|uniref:Ig-like domain-containing protein n=1 Tax=Paenibacillus sp. TAB 01 TaxID=3368988 RepID=UPI00375383D6
MTPGTDSGGSGVLREEYSLSGATTADWTVYTAPLAVSAQGETTVSARTVDQAGNKSQAQTEVVRIDRTAPSAPVVAPETEAWTAADSVTVTLTHGADTGGSGISRTEYSLSGATTLDWTDYTGVLTITAEGETVIHARTVDGAGNAGEASEAAVRIDRTAPDFPVVITPAAGTVTGNNKPTLAGTAERNAAVTLYVDGEALPAITADSGGQWTYTFPAALTDAEHKVKAVAADAAGNASGETAEVSFTVDTIAPGAPVIMAPQLNAVLAEARPVISGEAEPYAAVTLLLDTLPIDGLTADADGGWTYTPAAPLSDGPHSASAMAADAAGNASPASLTVSWKVDTQAPPSPVILSPAEGTATSGNNPIISGTAETSAEVTVIIDGTEAGTVMAAGSGGGWSFTPADPLADGAHTIRAAAKDAAGNTSVESDTIHITVDTQAPGVPEVTFPASGTILNTGRPAIQGRSEAGASIRITLDGTEADTALSDDGGIWKYTPEAAWSEGPHTFKAQAVDAAGNAGPLSEGTSFTVDTIAPPVPAVHQPAEGAVINRPKPAITGSAEASVTVNVYVDGAAAGRVHAADNGGWTYTPSAELAVQATYGSGASGRCGRQ